MNLNVSKVAYLERCNSTVRKITSLVTRLVTKGLMVWAQIKWHFDPVGGGGDSAYERGGDARRKVWIKPLMETDLGVAQAFFDP